jgi:hypothetical protein
VLWALRADAFFGTQDGKIVQMDRTGTDNGVPYVCTMVGGWEMFFGRLDGSVAAGASTLRGARRRAVPAATLRNHRLRDRHSAGALCRPDRPARRLGSGAVGSDAGLDAAVVGRKPLACKAHRRRRINSPTCSGTRPAPTTPHGAQHRLGVDWLHRLFHAPIVQVTIAQQAVPDIELISIAATYDAAGVNV